MREKSDELNQSNEDLKKFAYIASHDLKSPLSTISSYLQLLQRKYQGKALDQRAGEYIGHSVDAARHMAHLIDDLLQYSTIEQSDMDLEPTDMNQVLDTVRQNLAASIASLQASVSSDRLPTIRANGTQMVQLLQNLVANALKFHGPEAPRIHVSAEKRGAAWQFSVQDNGIGIEPQYADRLFQMFSRLHSSAEYEGTGIGLATVKRIVERHGGTVWFESEPGHGSTFFFTIPI